MSWLIAVAYIALLALLIVAGLKLFSVLSIMPEENEDFLFVEDPGINERKDLHE